MFPSSWLSWWLTYRVNDKSVFNARMLSIAWVGCKPCAMNAYHPCVHPAHSRYKLYAYMLCCFVGYFGRKSETQYISTYKYRWYSIVPGTVSSYKVVADLALIPGSNGRCMHWAPICEQTKSKTQEKRWLRVHIIRMKIVLVVLGTFKAQSTKSTMGLTPKHRIEIVTFTISFW